jgi:hypothetical protein
VDQKTANVYEDSHTFYVKNYFKKVTAERLIGFGEGRASHEESLLLQK